MSSPPPADQAASLHDSVPRRDAPSAQLSPPPTAALVSREQARRILYSLMICSTIMPFLGAMTTVALPIIRDDFQLRADVAAWVPVAFTLPFTVLTPVLGRLSDGVGRRRLILAGLLLFMAGTLITLLAANITVLLVGRAVQGFGLAGILPLSMAMISAIFPPGERGRALGTWSTTGPGAAFVGPLLGGLLAAVWGWRGAYFLPLVIGLLALLVVYRFVPAGTSRVVAGYVRRFDWAGVLLLGTMLTAFVFFLSSRAVTGIEPLHDWRLLAVALLAGAGLIWHERRRADPFLEAGVLRNRRFSRATLSAGIRMVGMGGLGFLLPLYLVDIHALSSTQLGVMLMVTPGAMLLVVRLGGQLSDRRGGKGIVAAGMTVQALVMLCFARLPADASLWLIAAVLMLNGLGVGLMLAALHNAALGKMPDEHAGAAAGVYAMARFLGVAMGGALCGVILQHFLDLSLPVLQAYQYAFLFLAGAALLGLASAFRLPE